MIKSRTFILINVLSVAAIFMNAFVLMKLWVWLLMPIFGLWKLDYLQCMAIALVVRFIAPACVNFEQTDTDQKAIELIGRGLASSTFNWAYTLLFAYILASFI